MLQTKPPCYAGYVVHERNISVWGSMAVRQFPRISHASLYGFIPALAYLLLRKFD